MTSPPEINTPVALRNGVKTKPETPGAAPFCQGRDLHHAAEGGGDVMGGEGQVFQPPPGRRCGELNPNARLSAEDARRIRQRDPENPRRYAEKGALLAALLGVSEKTVSLIRVGRRWGCIA